MIKIVPFTIMHYRQIEAQPRQEYIQAYLDTDHVRALIRAGDAFAGVRPDGTVVGAAGCMEVWKGRAVTWALLSTEAGKDFVQATRMVRRYLDVQPYRRIEATVDTSFDQAHRWVSLLGFRKESDCMKSYDPDGRDHALYARVR